MDVVNWHPEVQMHQLRSLYVTLLVHSLHSKCMLCLGLSLFALGKAAGGRTVSLSTLQIVPFKVIGNDACRMGSQWRALLVKFSQM